ncbi:MAG: alpha/beta hydrolase family protein [Lacisediminihabitans sp.]
MTDSRRHAVRRHRWWTVLLVVAGGAAALSAVVSAAVALSVARSVVTPPRRRAEDTRVLSVDGGASAGGKTITLSASPDAVVPGSYSFWFSAGTGHARLGDIVDRTETSVTRRVLSVDFGEIARARRGRFSGWFYLSPRDLGYPFENVEVATTLGTAPAWLIPTAIDSSRWVIQVHGRSVRRSEALRAVPVFREAGYTSLLISYRNDEDAPRSLDGRYGLGDTEWLDVEAALTFAVDHGAKQVVLMGWSMGGATVLQAVTRSKSAGVVRGLVLESPVVDWVTALQYQGKVLHLPGPIRTGILALIGRPWGRRLTGQSEAIDLDRLDFVRRATELALPILVLHSDDDGYVPSTASHALAAARPDIVTFEVFTVARHTKLWNYDRARWNRVIAEWLASPALTSERTAHPSRRPEAASG